MERKTHTIDAAGKILGRLAAEVAVFLRGKNKTGFLYYQDIGDHVIVKNADKIIISGKKISQKKYYRHSGYPRGFKEIPMSRVFEKSPSEVLRRAVLGMLPKNKLRAQQIKRLKFNPVK